MTIIGVILNKLMSSNCMSVDVISFTDFEEIAAEYSKAVIVLQLGEESYLFIDAIKLFEEEPLTLGENSTHVSSWTELAEYLNNFDSNILQKYSTTTIVPRTWKVSDSNGEQRFETTPFFSNIGTQLKIKSVENTFGLNVEYCDHSNFYERRKYGRSWNYPDISIFHTGIDNLVNFNNSIPIVNGMVFYPEVIQNTETGRDELVAFEAGKMLVASDWNQSRVKTVKHNKVFNNGTIINDYYEGNETPLFDSYCYNKGVMVLDFTPLGNISIIKLSDCTGHVNEDYKSTSNITISNPNRSIHTAFIKGSINYDNCSYYLINIELPIGTELGVPIVCICGRLFYLHEDTQITTTDDKIHLSVKIEKSLLTEIVLSNMQWFGKQITGTNIVETTIQSTLDNLFNETENSDIEHLLHEVNLTPFVIMLHSNKKLICTKTKPKITIGPDKFIFPTNAGGLLVNQRTREIVDYVRQFYASGTLIETCLQRPMNLIVNDIKQLDNDSVAFEVNKFKSRSKYKEFNEYIPCRTLDDYILIDFSYTEN